MFCCHLFFTSEVSKLQADGGKKTSFSNYGENSKVKMSAMNSIKCVVKKQKGCEVPEHKRRKGLKQGMSAQKIRISGVLVKGHSCGEQRYSLRSKNSQCSAVGAQSCTEYVFQTFLYVWRFTENKADIKYEGISNSNSNYNNARK